MYLNLSRRIVNLIRDPSYSVQRMASLSAAYHNKLNDEKSPYLLQHANNPVNWYPWGEEAFKLAKEQNKLIFLSVGYSTCHWCHVMERESFENEDTAKIMNEHYINVKVDREERPDVDKVYMSFVTLSSGRGGWPMSVFLLPDLTPVAAGTYFPPKDLYGRPGFPTVLNSIADKWADNPEKFKESGAKILEILKKNNTVGEEASQELPTDETFIRCVSQFSRSFESEYGGFSQAPKFPQPSNFNFLFTYKALNPDCEDAQVGLDMSLFTLAMMDKGGIHDHVAQGFARYSTDKRWHVPHFEKMLYDQAQLLNAYLDAYLTSHKQRYADVAVDILTYVLRDLSHPLGGFFSAEDADSLPSGELSKKKEGAFCVWTFEEINQLLSQPVDGSDCSLSQIFCFHYSVAESGNVDPAQDPHGELNNQNVLMSHGDIDETAAEFGCTAQLTKECLEKSLQILYEARQHRPKPHLDDKMLTAWNGMMLGATARAGSILGNAHYTQRALHNASFIKENLYKNGKLLRAAYKVDDASVSLGSEIEAYSDDYAHLIRGLIELYNSTLDVSWLEWAEQLQQKQDDLFWDSTSMGYFLSQKDDTSILLRMKEEQDGAEPSVNSVSAGNLVRLSRLLNEPQLEAKAAAIFKVFSHTLTKLPIALPEMLTALLLYQSPAEQIILSGDPNSESLQEMLSVVHKGTFNPNRILLIADTKPDAFLYQRQPTLRNYTPRSDKSLAFVCKDFSCSLPAKSAEQLTQTMRTLQIH